MIKKLYVKSDLIFNTPLELLNWMIPKNNTYFIQGTYHDKECTRLQGKECRRSFDDLYILFKTYFPKITKKFY